MCLVRTSSMGAALLAALSLPFLATAAHAQATGASAPRFYTAPDSVMKTLPFSEAVQVGNLLILSGQIGNEPGTMKLVPGGIGPEARQALANIEAILKRHGASLKDVVKCTIYLADIGEWNAFNAVYREVFAAPYPARSALGSSGLVFGARTEVECMAVVPGV